MRGMREAREGAEVSKVRDAGKVRDVSKVRDFDKVGQAAGVRAVAEVAEVAVLRFPRVVHLVTLLCSPAALTYDPTLAFERGKPATVGRTDAPS